MSRILGLCGAAGSGKSIAAAELERIGYERVRFSGPLKNMLRAFFQTCGLDEVEIERRIEGDLKEVPDVLLGGKTPRFAMQTLGKEWGRDLIAEDIWSKAWRSKAENVLASGKNVVAEDVRFNTEDHEIHRLGGLVVELIGRRKAEVSDRHASELFEGVHADLVCHNDGTIDELKGWFSYIFREEPDDEFA